MMFLVGNNGKTRRNSGRNGSVFYWWPPQNFQQKRKRRLQMNKFRFTLQIAAIATFLLAFASFAQAQATRT